MPPLPKLDLPSIFGGASSANIFNQQFVDVLSQAPQAPVTGSPAFAQLQQLLAPQTASGLSPNLEKLLELGRTQLQQSTSQDVASARTRAQGIGLEGSSIELAGIQGAQAAGQQGFASLLSNLLGQQQQASSQLAGLLFQGSVTEAGFDEERLRTLLRFLAEGGESAANIGLFQQGLTMQLEQAKQAREAQLLSSLIGAGSGIAQAGILSGRF